jgi:hypothetical protein
VDWSAHIPKELQAEKVWERHKGKDLGDILRRHVELDKYNAGAIKLPGEKETPEERSKKLGEIWGKLGRPVEASGYKAEMQLPEGVQLSEQHLSSFQQVAHKAGMTQGQYEAVMGFFAQYVSDGMSGAGRAAKESLAAGQEALRKEWGPNYDKNVALARRGFGSFAKEAIGEEAATGLVERITKTSLANDPDFMKIMSKLGAWMQEDNLISGDTEVNSKETIQTKIDTIKADPDYWNERSPRYESLVKQVDQLYRELHNPVFA